MATPFPPNPQVPLSFKFKGPIYLNFLQQVAKNPDAIALVSIYECCTYHELNAISDRIASYLLKKKIGRGSTVALYSERNPALIYALLGVLKTGATFFIADSAYPISRFLDCCSLTMPSFLLICGELEVDSKILSSLDEKYQTQTLRIPSTKKEALKILSKDFVSIEPSLINEDDIAYIIFTSGSTGIPKGIITSHAPLVHFIEWHVKQHDFTQHDRFSFLSGLSHDPALRDIFTPLSIGASLHIPEQSTLFNPYKLSSWLSEQTISVVHLTPALGEIICTSALKDKPLDRIRYFFWGGDTLNSKLSKRIFQIAPKSTQVNFYGTTETPQAMSYFVVDPTKPSQSSYPIGSGITDVQLLIVTNKGELAAIDEVGEIYVRTPYLSKGYLHDLEHTKMQFVTNPFTHDQSDLCYKTGDLGKYLVDGSALFLGRFDHQVKIRGFRIELEEIIARIEQQPKVARAIVITKELSNASKVLIAYFTCEEDKQVQTKDVQEALKKILPSHMVPSYIVKLEKFPLFPNGKINSLALPSPIMDINEHDLPQTEREKELAKVWQEILNTNQVGVNASFTDLGGDSLSVIEALIAMRRMGISEHLASGVIQGKTIAQIVNEENGITYTDPITYKGISNSAQISLLVNLLRCILIIIVVTDHWLPGLLNRLPLSFGMFHYILSPIFNIATPGFAFVFGLTVGYNLFPDYFVDPMRIRKRLRLGILLLGTGVLLSTIFSLAVLVVKKQTLTPTLVFVAPFGPLLYYYLAFLTIPLWFHFISHLSFIPNATQKLAFGRYQFLSRVPYEVKSSLCLMVIFYFAYHLCLLLFLDREQTGFLQLIRLILVAKYAYFNMSIGAVGGIALGIYLTKIRFDELDTSQLVLGGGLLSIIGLALLYFDKGNFALLYGNGDDMGLWRWFFYIGIILIIMDFLKQLIANYDQQPLLLRKSMNWGSVIGQCTLIIFVLHGLVLSFKALLEAIGLPEKIALSLPLLFFVLICSWVMGKIHRLYYYHS